MANGFAADRGPKSPGGSRGGIAGHRGVEPCDELARLPAPVLGFGYATVLSLALVLAPSASRAFVYFQF